jgi:hypothetical protein
MIEENMGVEPAEGHAEPASEQPAQTGLDKVYEEYKIEDAAQKFKADEFKPVAPVVREDGQEIMQTLNAVTEKLNSYEASRFNEAIQKDIASAVSAVEKETGLDADFIETHLDLMARKDGRFQTIWKNRHANPKALNAALKAVAENLNEKNQSRADPNLLANQKALRAYQSGSATRQSSSNDQWENLNPRQFEQMWNNV